MTSPCTEIPCPEITYARGLCRPHYASVMRQARLPQGVTSAGLQISPQRLEQERKYLAQVLLSAQRTHCKHGHAFTPENTRVHAKGYWICKICSRASKQRSQSKPVDMVSPIGPHNRDKTHCAQGHSYAEHGGPRPKGGRLCRRCTSQERRNRRYGLSQKQFETMLQEQKEVCAICQEPFATTQQTHVDHDHGTMQVRGLLCSGCNQALGLFKDDPDRMRRGATYLEQHRRVNPAPAAAPDTPPLR